ncbi:CheR family methyltransferase [Acutalibacter caecimuris]|uniref:CheR family methyltransferase n=1 Tax=Acutalibacter caecimuris TaxID=3093657 RepID=UPI002AC93796|nr:protein-glutamate O-methyltransferase CheR [Acutalibacter sp. M00118]
MDIKQKTAAGAVPSMTINDKDFNRLVAFVQSKYGIDLHQKRQLVTSRLSGTVKSMGFSSFTEYVDYLLKKGSGDDINHLLGRLTTNYTYFMREVESFDYFTRVILPEVVRRHERDKCLSIWSAACSSGEEPYNISMYIMDYLGGKASAWDTRLLASDISLDVLNKAKRGVYELPDSIPPNWKKDYFKPAGGKMYEVAPKIKNNVIFKQFNLMDPITFKRKFDVIFCRNVMIYFDQPTKTALARRMFDATVPGGYLVISKAENLPPDLPYTRVATSIFQKR